VFVRWRTVRIAYTPRGVSERGVAAIARLPCLEHLHLSTLSRLSPSAFALLASLGDHLRILELHAFSGKSLVRADGGAELLPGIFSSLTSLDLSECNEMFLEQNFFRCLARCRRIRLLCLKQTDVTDKTLMFLQELEHPTYLDLSYCPLIAGDGVERVCCSGNPIRRLQLCALNLDDDGMSKVNLLSNSLEELDLTDCCLLSSDFVDHLITCRGLRQLRLSADNMGMAALHLIATSFPALTMLCFDGCHKRMSLGECGHFAAHGALTDLSLRNSDDVVDLGRLPKYLTSLRLDGSRCTPGIFVAPTFSNVLSLRVLSVCEMGPLEVDDWRALAQSPRLVATLTVLKADRMPQRLGDGELLWIGHLSGLQVVSLDASLTRPAAGLLGLLSRLVHLRSLCLSRNEISVEDLCSSETTSAFPPGLCLLTVDACVGLDDAALNRLRDAVPRGCSVLPN
jgi:hypothetical protein